MQSDIRSKYTAITRKDRINSNLTYILFTLKDRKRSTCYIPDRDLSTAFQNRRVWFDYSVLVSYSAIPLSSLKAKESYNTIVLSSQHFETHHQIRNGIQSWRSYSGYLFMTCVENSSLHALNCFEYQRSVTPNIVSRLSTVRIRMAPKIPFTRSKAWSIPNPNSTMLCCSRFSELGDEMRKLPKLFYVVFDLSQ